MCSTQFSGVEKRMRIFCPCWNDHIKMYIDITQITNKFLHWRVNRRLRAVTSSMKYISFIFILREL